MAGQRPKFLTDLIFQSNPNINKNETILFDILESIMKNLSLSLQQFYLPNLTMQKFLHNYIQFLHTNLTTDFNFV